MWMARRHPERDHLGDYWNALNRGTPADELARLAAPLDPTLLAAIDRARALHRRRRPDPAFATQLERTLMDAFASAPAGMVPLRPTPSGQLNGRTAPRPRSSWIPSLPETKRRTGWLGAQLATAALIIVALAGIYLVVDNSDQPAVLPPIQIATPDAAPTGDWTNFKGDAAHRGVADAGPTGQPVELWRVQAERPLQPAAGGRGRGRLRPLRRRRPLRPRRRHRRRALALHRHGARCWDATVVGRSRLRQRLRRRPPRPRHRHRAASDGRPAVARRHVGGRRGRAAGHRRRRRLPPRPRRRHRDGTLALPDHRRGRGPQPGHGRWHRLRRRRRGPASSPSTPRPGNCCWQGDTGDDQHRHRGGRRGHRLHRRQPGRRRGAPLRLRRHDGRAPLDAG